MKRQARRSFLAAMFFLGAVARTVSAAAQDAPYPSKPITIIYPYAGGSASDRLTREVGEVISKALGQPVIVEAKPGAGGGRLRLSS